MSPVIIETAAKALIVAVLGYAGVVALTHWAVRARRIGPFGWWARLVRRLSDPVLLPVERRVIRAGGSPQDAPIWLLGVTVIGGLLLISLIRWALSTYYRLTLLPSGSTKLWIAEVVRLAFTVLIVALVVRVVGSWLGASRYRSWMRPVYALTDWLVEPIRRVLPPFGMLDLSPLLAYLVLYLGRELILKALL